MLTGNMCSIDSDSIFDCAYQNNNNMKPHKWILKVRNTLASLAGECDSAAAIEGAKMTRAEREELQASLRKIYEGIDKKLFG